MLLQNHHFREKISHVDHERIPERVVHARGAGAHGVFRGYGTAAKISQAGVFAQGKETEVFVRFSTVVGSRGSIDLARDTRGFAGGRIAREHPADARPVPMTASYIEATSSRCE